MDGIILQWKKLSALLREIKHPNVTVILIVWIVFIPLKQKSSLNYIWNYVCGNKYFYKVVTSVINTKKLIKHHDLCRSWKFNSKYWCKNNSENWFVTKLGEHFPSDFPASSISSFRSIENKHDVCRGKDCMKKFCASLREQAMRIIRFFKNEVIYKRTAKVIWKYKHLLYL